MTKSLGQAFSKACGSRAEPWELPIRTIYRFVFAVLRSGEPEKPIKGVSVGKALLDAGLSQNCEDSTSDYAVTGTTWAGTALTVRTLCPSSTVRWTVVRRHSACAPCLPTFTLPNSAQQLKASITIQRVKQWNASADQFAMIAAASQSARLR